MPRLKEVDDLGSLCTDALANFFHESFKLFTCPKYGQSRVVLGVSVSRPSRLHLHRFRYHFADVLKSLPASIQTDIFQKMVALIKADGGVLLREEYYKVANIFLNEKTRHLNLTSARLFQDSSLALESFLTPSCLVSAAASLQSVNIGRAVVELADFDFVLVLAAIAEVSALTSLSLQGLNQVDATDEDMARFIRKLAKNCKKLHSLDLSDSNLGGSVECLEGLCEMSSLRVLKLDRCGLETAAAVAVLTKLRDLVCFDCDDKLQAVAGMADDGFDSSGVCLHSATFRHLRGLSKVSRAWPSLRRLRLVYRAYEEPVGSAARLDEGLTQLQTFHHDATVELEIQGLNLLVPNQMESLPLVGGMITQLALTQGEFLHPQAMNPWAKHCPNLRKLEIVGCGAITDEMFVGEVPELMETPFRGLEELHFEGSLTFQLAHFLLRHCVDLAKLTIRSVTKRFESRILTTLTESSRPKLKEACFALDFVESDFVQVLHKVIEESPHLSHLELLCFEKSLQFDLEELERCIKMSNWDLKFLHHIKRRPKR